MHVSIIDTSVLCNIMNIPNRNQNHEEIIHELKNMQQDRQQLLILPFATMIETGNHIAHISDGNTRRERARMLAELIQRTVNDEAPWSYYGKEFDREELLDIANSLVDHAVAEIGIGDLSIVQVYKTYKKTVPAIGSIRIWSLDHHLRGYSEEFSLPKRRKNK